MKEGLAASGLIRMTAQISRPKREARGYRDMMRTESVEVCRVLKAVFIALTHG